MRRSFLSVAVLLLAMISIGALSAADDKEKQQSDKNKEAAFCPVGGIGHKIKMDTTAADFEGGKVHFCCDDCPAEFKKDSTKFAANARHQLLATGQIEQVACPISGQKIDPEKTADVAGLKIAFCCENCQGKVAKIEKAEEKIALLFKEKLTDSKAFKLKKKDDKKAEKTEAKS